MWCGPDIHLVILARGNEPVTITTKLEREHTALVLLQLVLLGDTLVNVEQLDIAGLHTVT